MSSAHEVPGYEAALLCLRLLLVADVAEDTHHRVRGVPRVNREAEPPVDVQRPLASLQKNTQSEISSTLWRACRKNTQSEISSAL